MPSLSWANGRHWSNVVSSLGGAPCVNWCQDWESLLWSQGWLADPIKRWSHQKSGWKKSEMTGRRIGALCTWGLITLDLWWNTGYWIYIKEGILKADSIHWASQAAKGQLESDEDECRGDRQWVLILGWSCQCNCSAKGQSFTLSARFLTTEASAKQGRNKTHGMPREEAGGSLLMRLPSASKALLEECN